MAPKGPTFNPDGGLQIAIDIPFFSNEETPTVVNVEVGVCPTDTDDKQIDRFATTN